MEVINHSIWPEMSLLLGGGHLQQATAVHRAAVASTLATGFASVAFAAVLGPWIFGVWTLHRLPPVTHSLMAIFALSILAQSMWHASFFVHLAANKHEGAALRFVTGAILAVALCYPLAKIGGLYGAAGSPLILDALMIPHTVCTALQMTGDTLPGFLAGLVPAARAGVSRVCSTVHRLAGF
jgi:O-antigen/teichoic acid export membrane protein